MELLRDVRVLEVSLFSADALGGHLADLGADVIKVEPPGGGGFRGSAVSGGELQDSHWNRGKKSVAINLKTAEGQDAFRRLAATSAVVIDGLRYGTAQRLGFSYDDIVAVNPTVVYCVLNGMGSYGPYTRLATHGLSFDCFAGLSPPIIEADGTPRLSGAATGTTGVLAGPLYAAMGVLAALHAAGRDGKPQYVEVAQVDAAINWNFQHLSALANGQPAYGEGIRASLRYQYYRNERRQLRGVQRPRGQVLAEILRVTRQDGSLRTGAPEAGGRCRGRGPAARGVNCNIQVPHTQAMDRLLHYDRYRRSTSIFGSRPVRRRPREGSPTRLRAGSAGRDVAAIDWNVHQDQTRRTICTARQRRTLGSIRKSYSAPWRATTRPEWSAFVRRVQSEHRRMPPHGSNMRRFGVLSADR